MACATSQGHFLDGQDTSAYVAPACVLEPPSSWALRHAKPFGPVVATDDAEVFGGEETGPVRPPLSIGVVHRTLALVS